MILKVYASVWYLVLVNGQRYLTLFFQMEDEMSAFLKDRSARMNELLKRHDHELSEFDLETVTMGLNHAVIAEASRDGFQDDDLGSVRGSVLSLASSVSYNSFNLFVSNTTTTTALWLDLAPSDVQLTKINLMMDSALCVCYLLGIWRWSAERLGYMTRWRLFNDKSQGRLDTDPVHQVYGGNFKFPERVVNQAHWVFISLK